MSRTEKIAEHEPAERRLRGFSFDPSLSASLDTAPINQRVYTVPWEKLQPGPVGSYLEVVDYDPASGAWYDPVDLNNAHLLAQDGLPPLSSNPQFHQQMVYAVAMTTIKNFERALGRPVMWSDRRPDEMGKEWADFKTEEEFEKLFVERLRIYPHAMRQANAYYSPSKKALLFGYFPAAEAGAEVFYPGGIVFGCLSHDVVAHETAHAILDGIYPRFMEVTQPDGLAFHEAFADIVAMFQHFTFTDVVRHQIAKTRGDLEINNLLGQLAQEFGRATGGRGSLRNALGQIDKKTGVWVRNRPDPRQLADELEPHARGSILVSAVFDAFVTMYNSRIADLRRIASNGTGILQDGDLHPDLVNRLADEAVKTATTVLTMCIRALDYCPPVDLTFGDYLRAIITADADIVPTDSWGCRLAFIAAFQRYGIFPPKLRSLSEESLKWDVASEAQRFANLTDLGDFLKPIFTSLSWHKSRKERWVQTRAKRAKLHEQLKSRLKLLGDDKDLQRITGLDFSIMKNKEVRFQVHSLWPVQRQRLDGSVMTQVVFCLLQRRPIDPEDTSEDAKQLWGGCTIIYDLNEEKIRYVIRKPLFDQNGEGGRLTMALSEMNNPSSRSLAATYGMGNENEPFAMLHSCH